MPGRVAAGLLAFALAVLVPHPLRASAADVYGLGSEAIARGGAMTAVATGHESTFYNPAGLAVGGRRELSFGYLRILPDLEVAGARGRRELEIDDPDIAMLGVVAPLGRHAGIGFTSYILPTTILHVVARAPDEAFSPYFSNRTQRLLLLPGVGVKPFDWLALGVAVNFFAGLSGGASASAGPTREVETSASEELPTTAAIHAGLRVLPSESLALGLAYRQAFRVPYATTTTNVVAGAPLDVALDAQALQTPHELAAGVAVTLDRLELSLDGTWLFWGAERGPYVRVSALISGVRIDQLPPEEPFHDTFNLRLGAAFERDLSQDVTLALRGGQWFEPTFVGNQPGRSNLIDGTKLGWSVGAGLLVKRILPRPFRFDVHLQAISMLSRRHEKRISSIEQAREDPNALADEEGAAGVQISNEGYPAIAGGGRVYTLGATLTLEVEP